MPMIRRVSNWLSTCLINFLFRCSISDSQCGFRAYNRKTLERINSNSLRYEGETETLIKAKMLGLNIVEVPIRTIYLKREKKFLEFRYIVDIIDFLRTLILIAYSTFTRVMSSE